MSLSCTAPAMSASRIGPSRRLSRPPMRSFAPQRPASAARTCGPTGESNRWTSRDGWDTSTPESSRRSGSAVTTIRPGQFVVGSFFASDNTCEICLAGYQSSCLHREPAAPGGAQAERMRVPLADGTLVATPDIPTDDLIPSLLAASDVLGTGWFAATAAQAGPGKTVAVVGDGAVGLLGVLAARQLGAERIIVMSRHEPRQQLAHEFGASDIVDGTRRRWRRPTQRPHRRARCPLRHRGRRHPANR